MWLASTNGFDASLGGRTRKRALSDWAASGLTLADVDAACAAARKAFEGSWGKLSGAERGKYLFRIARLIQERAREFAVAESLDNGKPIRETRDIDIPLVAAWFYTGGKKPYGYAGLGEVVAFLFFGLVAVFGTAYVQVATMFDNSTTVMVTSVGAVSIGLLAAAVLLVNNLRDQITDAPAGKKTLSVRFGKRTSQVLFSLFVLVGAVQLGLLVVLYPLVVFAFAAYLLLLPAVLIVWTYRQPSELVLALKLTSFGALVWGVVAGWGLHAFLLV